MTRGRICHYTLRGFGFIAQPGLPDLFFHIGRFRDFQPSAPPEITVGAEVAFTVVQTPKGLAAENIELVQPEMGPQ